MIRRIREMRNEMQNQVLNNCNQTIDVVKYTTSFRLPSGISFGHSLMIAYTLMVDEVEEKMCK